ncbi:MAG: hypothetical protein ABIP56_00395 [Dokdonella sp.]
MQPNKFLLILSFVVAPFALVACDKLKDATSTNAPAVEAPAAAVVMPTDPNDSAGWKKYLGDVVMKNMEGVKSNRPYMYYVPAGEDEKAIGDRANQLENVQGVVGRGVLPGNMMAFGGPNSATTADFVVKSFEAASPNSFKDVVVLVVTKPEDKARVSEALAPSGAIIRMAEMR